MCRNTLLLATALALFTTTLEAAPSRRKAVRAQPVAQAAVFHGQSAAAMISAYRAQYGLGPVVLDPRLTQAAAYQARANA